MTGFRTLPEVYVLRSFPLMLMVLLTIEGQLVLESVFCLATQDSDENVWFQCLLTHIPVDPWSVTIGKVDECVKRPVNSTPLG